MKTDNKQLGISGEVAITEPYVIKIIKELCPEGATYANRVMALAVDLSDELYSFYTGSFLCDYGCYPFLIVKEYHYEVDCYLSDQVIVKSMFDIESFNEWMDCLSIPLKIRDMIKGEVHVYYDNYHQSDSDNFDVVYLDVMKHLIQSFKCLRKIYDNTRKEIDMVFRTPIGAHRHVSLTSVLTLSYLMKKVKRFNRNKGAASGTHLLVLKVGSSDDQVIVNCEKCNKK